MAAEGLTEIKVIESVGDIPLNKLTIDDRRVIFDRLKNESTDDIAFYNYDTFHTNYTELLARNFDKPDILELKFRKIIELSAKLYPLLPVLENFAKDISIKKRGHIRYYKSSHSRGGAIEIAKKKIDLSELTKRADKETKATYQMRIIFDWIQPARRLNNSTYNIPPGESARIIGYTPGDVPECDFTDLLLGRYEFDVSVLQCIKSLVVKYGVKAGDHRLFGLDIKETSKKLDELYNSIRILYDTLFLGILDVYSRELFKTGKYFTSFYKPTTILASKPREYIGTLKVLSDQLGTLFNAKIISDRELILLRLAPVYYSAMRQGKDSKKVLDFLSKKKRENALLAFQKNERAKKFDTMVEVNLYKHIIIQKIGEKRFNDIFKSNLYVDKKSLLTKLSAAEKKIVEEEYERRQTFIKNTINNKCPHVKIYNQLRRSNVNSKTSKLLTELDKFFVKKTAIEDKFIKCNNCGFDIMCPHVVTMIKATLAGKTYHIMREILSKFIMTMPNTNVYFCKICGENISEIDIPASFVSDEMAKIQHSIDDELKSHIWGEMVGILQKVKFNIVVNPAKIINAMISACYEFLFEIEKQLLKSRTNTPEEVKRRRKLFISIYGYAYLVQLIMANKKKPPLEFRGMKGAENATEVDYLKFIINDIINSRNVLLSKLKLSAGVGVSVDFVKNKVIEAYKAISTKGEQTVRYSDSSEDFYSTIQLDPFYHRIFTYHIAMTKKIADVKADVKYIDELLGGSVDALAKGKAGSIYSHVKKLNWNTDYINKPYSAQTTISELARTWKAGYKSIRAQSFNNTLEFIKSGDYTKSWLNEDNYSQVAIKYDSAADELKAKEAVVWGYRQAWLFRPTGWLPYKTNISYNYRDVGLYNIFDEKGNKHKFNIYKYSNGKYSLDDINKSLREGKSIAGGQLIDRICSVCGVLESEVNKLNNKKIKDNLEFADAIDNFMRMYENRCPKGGVHEFDKSGVCKKCHINSDTRYKPRSTEAEEYYNKFKDIYLSDVKKTVDELVKQEYVQYEFDKKVISSVDEFNFKYDVILQLNNKLKTNVNAFMTLGATENIEYNTILAGKYIPPEPEEKNSPQLYKIVNYVYMLIREYNQLKHSHRLTIDYDLQVLVDNSGIKKNELSHLSKLPDVANNFTNKLEYMKTIKMPKRLWEFVMQSLAEKLWMIYNINDSLSQKLRTSFVEFFMKKILKSESLTSKADLTLWALFRRGEREAAETYETNYDLDYGLETENELEKDRDDNEDYGATNELFSMDAYDVDITDGDPDDVGDNEIKVDGYGLD